MKLRSSVMNEEMISSAELSRAACCNLGESFVTNPSVDVSYSDAATGAKQIKLLGLSGTYVQMLTENIPNYRGAAAPYGLGYVPGPWMQSIQVSKGTSSVKNGYEAITGQINVEFKKPQLPEADWVSANLFASTTNRYEANADGLDKLSLITQQLVDFGIRAGERILIATLVFIVGRFLISMLNRFVGRPMDRRKVDISIKTFVKSLVNILLTILLIISVVGALGVETTSFALLFVIMNYACKTAMTGIALAWGEQTMAATIMMISSFLWEPACV